MKHARYTLIRNTAIVYYFHGPVHVIMIHFFANNDNTVHVGSLPLLTKI